MYRTPNPSIILFSGLFTLPFTLTAQRLVLNDTTLIQSAGLFVSEMELISGTRCIMTGSAFDFDQNTPDAGYIASVYLDSCDWAQGQFVGWSRTISDTSHFHLNDSTYVRQDGSILGCTALDSGAVLACGSTGQNDRAGMVALLQADGDTVWTTSVRSLPGHAWFSDAQQAADGSIYCVGSVRDTLDMTDHLIARFTPGGELLWYRTIPLPETNDDARQCFVQGDTLIVFSFTGDIPSTDTINEGVVGVLRISSAGELLDSRRLAMPERFTYGKVMPDGSGGFFFCTAYLEPLESGMAECGVLHLNGALDTVGVPWKVSDLNGIDGSRGVGLAYDALSNTLFIGGAGPTGVGIFGSFVVAVPLAQPDAAWGRLVHDVPILFGGIGLTDDNMRVRLLVAQYGTGRTYVHSWDAATGDLGPAATCEWETYAWAPAIEPWEVVIAEAPMVLAEPVAEAYHGLTFAQHTWVADVCPAPPTPDACIVGIGRPVDIPLAQVWPNPVAPGELVRFAGRAQVYDALGRTIRTNVTQMAAPEQPGCYLVVMGGRRSVLVVQE